MDATIPLPTDPPAIVAIRQTARSRDPLVRVTRLGNRARLLDELAEADIDLADRARDRQRIVQQLETLRDELWPAALWSQGRRPRPGRLVDPLPPLPEGTTWLWGRPLRAVSLELLERCGPLSLPDLHALLHLHGYGVAGAHPVKVLADALGHEVDEGRAERPARGQYRIAAGCEAPRPR